MHGIGTIKSMNNKPVTKSFGIGEKVIYAGKHKGTIIKVDYPVKDDNNNPGALVEWDDKGLAPPQMGVPYRALTRPLPTGNQTFSIQGGGLQEIELEDAYDIGEDPWSYGMNKRVNPATHCPECGDKWHSTESMISGIWYDCIKCNKTKEQIMKERKQ